MDLNRSQIFRYGFRFLLFFLIMLLLLYFINEFVLYNFFGTLEFLMVVYAGFIAVAAMVFYKDHFHEEEIEDYTYLKNKVERARFKILEERNQTFLLKPKFDYPYSLFNMDTIEVGYSDGVFTASGPKYYVDNFVKDVRGESRMITRILSRISIVMLLFATSIFPLIPNSPTPELRLRDIFRVTAVDIVEIEDKISQGNTIANINNVGLAVEDEDYIFFVFDHSEIRRVNKDFEDMTSLYTSKVGAGIYDLNLIEDWLFFRERDEYHRMKIDGTGEQTIYISNYFARVNLKGNWIYFMDIEDNFNIYKMDINGENKSRFLNLPATNIAIYEDRLYFSTGGNNDLGLIESIALDGYDRRTELSIMNYDFTIHDGHFYYIGKYKKLYRVPMESSQEPEIIVDDVVGNYIVTDSGIFYTLQLGHEFYDGEGLYMLGLYGSDKGLILDEGIFGSFAYVGDYLLFSIYDEYDVPVNRRLDVTTGEIEEIN